MQLFLKQLSTGSNYRPRSKEPGSKQLYLEGKLSCWEARKVFSEQERNQVAEKCQAGEYCGRFFCDREGALHSRCPRSLQAASASGRHVPLARNEATRRCGRRNARPRAQRRGASWRKDCVGHPPPSPPLWMQADSTSKELSLRDPAPRSHAWPDTERGQPQVKQLREGYLQALAVGGREAACSGGPAAFQPHTGEVGTGLKGLGL